MKKQFEAPKVMVIYFAMQESITWENANGNETDLPGTSVGIDEW